MRNNVSRRKFLFSSAALAFAADSSGATPGKSRKASARADQFAPQLPISAKSGIRVRFLGSGASGWNPKEAANPHARHQSSVLLENKVLIDFTMCAFDMLPGNCRPDVLFLTHSHNDHYDPLAAVKSGVKRIYVQQTWSEAACEEVRNAAAKLKLPAPEVIGLPFGRPVVECGMRFTGVPANHSTSRVTNGILERPSLYLVEKGDSRLLYATDTGGLTGDAAVMIGIDPHVSNPDATKVSGDKVYVHRPQAITALIMEATNGDSDDDFRLFVHSSVQSVARIVNMLLRHKRFAPPPGQHAYITHLGVKYRNWPAKKIEEDIPDVLRAAYDGLELVLG